MLKRILLYFFFTISAATVKAQSVIPVTKDSSADTAYKKILLIPYNPIMHLSDADVDIMEYNQQKEDVIRAAFRKAMLQSVAAKLEGLAETMQLRPDISKEIQQDLEMIYGSVNYKMDTIFPVAHPVKDTLAKKTFFSKNHAPKVKEIRDLKYMNIALSHPELLKKLGDKYETDLFVFLNQFEIKTNYSDCLDLALKIYKRQLKLHYSVFDITGKQLYGDVAIVDFPSNTNDMTEIMRGNFPKIAEYVRQSIPKKNSKIK